MFVEEGTCVAQWMKKMNKVKKENLIVDIKFLGQ